MYSPNEGGSSSRPQSGPETDRLPEIAQCTRCDLTPRGEQRLRRRLEFVSLIERGIPIHDALQRSKLNVTERSARLLIGAYQARGSEALLDRRFLRQVAGRNPRPARLPEIEAFVRRQVAQGCASTAMLTRVVAEFCRARGLPVPSASTLRRILTDERAKARAKDDSPPTVP